MALSLSEQGDTSPQSAIPSSWAEIQSHGWEPLTLKAAVPGPADQLQVAKSVKLTRKAKRELSNAQPSMEGLYGPRQT